MKEIPLSRGVSTLVDDEDFEVLDKHKWFAHPCRSTVYAQRSTPRRGGNQGKEYVHRIVLARKLGRPLDREEFPDHENGNGLDNRRENLRLATNAQNQRNCRRKRTNLSSQYLGVSWHKNTGRWQASIKVNGTKLYLGLHSTEIDAARAREAYITAHPELMARPNFTGSEAPEGKMT
jgi:hypothetical protein